MALLAVSKAGLCSGVGHWFGSGTESQFCCGIQNETFGGLSIGLLVGLAIEPGGGFLLGLAVRFLMGLLMGLAVRLVVGLVMRLPVRMAMGPLVRPSVGLLLGF